MSRKNRSRKQQDPKPRAPEAAAAVTAEPPALDAATVEGDAIEASEAVEAIEGLEPLESGESIETREPVDAIEASDTGESSDTADESAAVAVDVVDAVEAVEADAVETAVIEVDAPSPDGAATDAAPDEAAVDAEPPVVVVVDVVDGIEITEVAEGAEVAEAAEIGDVTDVVESDSAAMDEGEAVDMSDAAEAEALGVVDDAEVARASAASYEPLKAIIEALIFASPEPLTPKTLYKLLESEPKEDVETALALLRQDYEQPGGLQLVEVAGGYQIVTRQELHEYVRRLFHERTTSKLSVQALETLAVIAYKQPITAPEITEIRGVNTSGVLNTLIDRKLVKIVGRKNVVGRPFMYATTRDFLDKFGLNDLTDLPKVEDLADVLGFDPPSLDAAEPSAETLAFDFGDPEELGVTSLGATASGATPAGESSAAEDSTAIDATDVAPTPDVAETGVAADDVAVDDAAADDAAADEGPVDSDVAADTGVQSAEDGLAVIEALDELDVSDFSDVDDAIDEPVADVDHEASTAAGTDREDDEALSETSASKTSSHDDESS